jgi:hypothetical protein
MKSLTEWHQLCEILTNITENIEPQVRYPGSLRATVTNEYHPGPTPR